MCDYSLRNVIVGGIGEEGLPAMGCGPSRCRIGRRDELGHDIGRSAEGLIVEHSHIFFDRPAGCFWRQPLLTLDPFLPIGIRIDQTSIDRKGFAADQSLADAALQNRLKDAS